MRSNQLKYMKAPLCLQQARAVQLRQPIICPCLIVLLVWPLIVKCWQSHVVQFCEFCYFNSAFSVFTLLLNRCDWKDLIDFQSQCTEYNNLTSNGFHSSISVHSCNLLVLCSYTQVSNSKHLCHLAVTVIMGLSFTIDRFSSPAKIQRQFVSSRYAKTLRSTVNSKWTIWLNCIHQSPL